MSENKNYKIIKTTAGEVFFTIHPVSNPMLQRFVQLTDEHPIQPVPLDWALGVFADPGVYSLYQDKKITFDDNDIVKEAFNAGVYFDDALDFIPATPDLTKHILTILKSGNRTAINELIDKEGTDIVKNVVVTHVGELTQAVIRMLENIFKIQLTVDGE